MSESLKVSTNRPINVLRVKIKKFNVNAIVPKYQTYLSSGFDFHALEDVTIEAGQTKLVKTGIGFGIPEGYEIQVRPRSGTSLKTELRIANSPGTIDADFIGQVSIIVTHSGMAVHGHHTSTDGTTYEGSEPITIKEGDRIAQGVLCPVFKAKFFEVEELEETDRGAGGFGSTGS